MRMGTADLKSKNSLKDSVLLRSNSFLVGQIKSIFLGTERLKERPSWPVEPVKRTRILLKATVKITRMKFILKVAGTQRDEIGKQTIWKLLLNI